jgi:hypothetical protein
MLRKLILTLVVVLTALSGGACSSPHIDALEKRLEKRNDRYYERLEARRLRRQAREERFRAWYRALMD